MKLQRGPRKFFILPKFQLRLIGANIVLMVLFAFSVFEIINYSFSIMREYGIKASLESDHPFFELIGLQQAIVLKYTSITLAFFLVVSTVLYLLFSHKMVGPFYRLKMYFKDYKPGVPIKFRKGDYLEELAPDINKFVERREN